MKILSIVIIRKDFNGSKIIAADYDVSTAPFFQRGTYGLPFITVNVSFSLKEFLAFFSKTIAERTEKGVRQSVEENGTLLTFLLRD